MTSAGRVAKEIAAICKPDSSGVIAVCAADDMRVQSNPGWRHLVGTITGPEGTPYEGGVFDVDILIPREYPFEPPKMKFITRIWHPNISSQTGAICLVSWDVYNDDLMAFGMSNVVGFLAAIGSEEYFCSESMNKRVVAHQTSLHFAPDAFHLIFIDSKIQCNNNSMKLSALRDWLHTHTHICFPRV